MMFLPFQTKILQFHRIIGNKCSRSKILHLGNIFHSEKREIHFFLHWFITIFNSVDSSRLASVGPDCTCAEWLLRNGAAVRFKGHLALLGDYNELMKLEEAEAKNLKVEEIYAEGAWLSPAGFDHLRGCKHVNKITLIFCSYILDSALFKLEYVKDTLKHLELRSCFNISDEGLKSLKDLKNLQILIISDLVSVNNKDECEIALRKALPQCKIEFDKGDKV